MKTKGSSVNRSFFPRATSNKISSKDSTERIVPLEFIRVDSGADQPIKSGDIDIASLHDPPSASYGIQKYGDDHIRYGQTRG